jgi:hypothetical protein
MLEIQATTEIDAPADIVWRVLTDLAAFHEWNPFIREARGKPELGGTINVRVVSSLGLRLGFSAQVLACEPAHVLRWRGHVGAPWLACGDHSFTILPVGPGRVRLVQRETFSGLLPGVAKRLLRRETQRGFDAMNRALKATAERARIDEQPLHAAN